MYFFQVFENDSNLEFLTFLFQAEHGGSRQNNELMSQINLRLRQFEEHIQSNRSQIEESNTQDG